MTGTQQGFTLVELLVAIAIVGILAVIAIPTIRSTIQNYRVSAVTEQLYSVLQFARTEAVKRNTNVYVSFTTGDTWCYGVNPGAACNCNTAGNCTLGAFSADSAQQTSLSSSYGSNIYFEGSHGAANASGSFTYTVYGTTRSLTLNVGRLGGVNICATNLSGYTSC